MTLKKFDKSFGMLEKYENSAHVIRIFLVVVMYEHLVAIAYHSTS